MYKDFFPNSLDDAADIELFKRFTGYLKKATETRREAFLKQRKSLVSKELPVDFSKDLRLIDEADADADREIEQMLIWDAVQRNLDGLTAREHEVLMCSYFLGMSDCEIADKFGMYQQSIHRCRHAALNKLKKRLRGNV